MQFFKQQKGTVAFTNDMYTHVSPTPYVENRTISGMRYLLI